MPTDTIPTVPATTFLRFDDEINDSVRAALFGVLVELAAPVVEHYRGDLYHDVHWIDRHATGPLRFYYGVRDTGTGIGTDRDLVVNHNTLAWQVDLTVNARGKWESNLVRIK
jgi:hypothetical protein